MTKNKPSDVIDEEVPLQPPEPEYISAKFKLMVPVNDPHFDEKWELRKYAAKLVEQKVGDEVQVTDLKVKMPGMFNKLLSKILGRPPEAKLFVTVKF